MSKLTDRAAYLRGLAEGLQLDTEKPQNKLLLEVLDLLDDMTRAQSKTARKLKELSNYVDEIDEDLSEIESYLYDEDDEDECDCDDCHCEDCDCDDCDDCDCCGDIHFECPKCGKPVVVNPDDIEADESPVCPYCGEPFFTDVDDLDEEEGNEEEAEESVEENEKE